MTKPGSAGPARAWVEVDLDAIVANARTVMARAQVPLLPMVKANAYGLGAVPVARALDALAPWGFGVATPEEGAELRATGIARPVLVFLPYRAALQAPVMAAQLTPVIGDLPGLEAWSAHGEGRPFHVEIDTGMGRSGFRADDPALLRELAGRLTGTAGYQGLFTHFHSAETDDAATERQWRLFTDAAALLPRPAMLHAANSAAAMGHGHRYAADLVRPGIFLYGARSGAHAGRPVVSLRAPVVAVRQLPAGASVGYGAAWVAPRPSLIATLAVGYADGVPRVLGPGAEVLLGGRRCPIRGRVTMDLTMVEVEEAPALGDVATIYGERGTLDDLAECAGTVSYELIARLAPRVVREYTRRGA